ncbi:MAG: molybdopterin-dependent oxidoreductase [Thaumarchaeota archaeon]|nr:molybdopterin-dependent oxidoreductase [Nitrososphaerota archaeon]
MVSNNRGSSLLRPFSRGAFAGIVSLGFLFILRLGNISPYPPESALEGFLKIIPASVQEPSVQALGEFAGQLGLIIATLAAVLVFGLLGIFFDRFYIHRMLTKNLSRFEKFLIFSLIPWLLFGLVVLPISGVSFFGVSSGFGSPSIDSWAFPLSLFVGSAIFGVVLSWQYGDTRIFVPGKLSTTSKAPSIREPQNLSRRSFVEKGAVALGSLALLVTSLDSLLGSAPASQPVLSGSGTPVNLGGAPSIFADPRLAPLVDSEITSNDNFYRVAIDVFDPSVDLTSWSLQVSGVQGNGKTYTLSQLQALPKSTEYNTFECVSNEINGNLVSNAKWGGVKLSDLFADAGGVPSSTQYVVFYSVDGYSVGIPITRAMMSDSMVAYEMNDIALPQKHGFPLRAVVPGLYGMMSAKWIRKIQLMDSTYMGYWQTRGWSNVGTVQTVAFVILPGDGAEQSLSLNNGSILIGGYAYSGDRGISNVEVSTDGGKTWQSAQLKPSLANNTWTLWAFDWHPTSTGAATIYARATDGTGALQQSNPTATFPNGATGYAMTSFVVSS